jgi:hypothetical protein
MTFKVNKDTKLKTTTTIDDLAIDPSLAKFLSPKEATDMLARVMAVQPVLMVQAFFDKGNEQRDTGDRLLKVDKVACLLNSPQQLLDGCKHRAIDEGRNLQDVVTDVLEAYLKTKTKPSKGKR